MSFIYLASPYSNPSQIVKELRYREISRIAAALVAKGEVIFCPIAMSHSFSKYGTVPTSWEFWEHQDLPFLELASQLWIVAMPGWEESVGVTAEVSYAQNRNIPIKMVDPHTGLTSEFQSTPHRGVF